MRRTSIVDGAHGERERPEVLAVVPLPSAKERKRREVMLVRPGGAERLRGGIRSPRC